MFGVTAVFQIVICWSPDPSQKHGFPLLLLNVYIADYNNRLLNYSASFT